MTGGRNAGKISRISGAESEKQSEDSLKKSANGVKNILWQL